MRPSAPSPAPGTLDCQGLIEATELRIRLGVRGPCLLARRATPGWEGPWSPQGDCLSLAQAKVSTPAGGASVRLPYSGGTQ